MKEFKTIQDFNWAWRYYCVETSVWVQFDCMECLQLEYNYHAYQISGKDKLAMVQIVTGLVDLRNNTMVMQQEGTGASKVVQVARTDNDAQRKRPNSFRRHDIAMDIDYGRRKSKHFIY